MNYFDGLSFVIAGGKKATDVRHSRVFKDYYGVQFFDGEALEVDIDGRHWHLDGSWCLITYPGPSFQYGAPEGMKLDHCYICFRGPRVEGYLSSGLLPLDPEFPLLKITAPRLFQDSMDKVFALRDLNSKAKHDTAVHLLEGVLLQLRSQPEPLNIPSHLQSRLSDLYKEMRERPELEWDFSSEARRMGISCVYLRILFHKLAGMPPVAFLLERRIEKASRMLLEGERQVSEVAAACGFSDVFYFSRAFKKRRLVSPLRYRKEFSGSIL